MHARIDHLLSLRDGEPVDVALASHVERCPTCSAQLQHLIQVKAQLRALPQRDAPASSWEQIQSRMSRAGAERRSGRFVAAATLAMLSVVLAIAVHDDNSRDAQRNARSEDRPEVTSDPAGAAQVAELVAQSQKLEHLLGALPERPRVERVSTAAMIDTIEQRIQWLDFQLSYAPDSGLNEEQARRLWRERVELMDSLVKVRYAEAGRVSF